MRSLGFRSALPLFAALALGACSDHKADFDQWETHCKDDPNCELYVATLTVPSATLPDAYVGSTYNFALVSEGGKGPYSWAIVGGDLPAGVSLSASGQVSGSPTTVGTASFTIRVTDGRGVTADGTFQVGVLGALGIATAALPDGYLTQGYATSLAVSGGKGPFAFSARGVPQGLSLSGAGAISGTPTDAADYSLDLTVTDGNGKTFTRTLPLTVYPLPAVATSSLPDGYQGVAYAQSLSATGGKGPFVFSYSGSFPTGLSATAAGAISGTPTVPTAPATATIAVSVTDANGRTGVRSLTFGTYAVPTIATASLADAYEAETFTRPISASGGKAPLSFSISGAPVGVSVDASTGALSGAVATGGASSIDLTVSDANGRTFTRTLPLTVYRLPSVSTSAFPDGYVGVSGYSGAASAIGGKAPYTFAISGAVPAGLSASGGTLSGTPSATDAVSLGVQVTDANGRQASATVPIVIYDRPSITTSLLNDRYSGEASVQSLTASGGKGTLTFQVAAGTLPTGLNLSAAGALSGASTVLGDYSPSFTVKDQNNQASDPATLQLSVLTRPSVPAATMADAYVGTPYNQQVVATGGRSPYTMTFTGTLPSGLSMGTSGTVTGTPDGADRQTVAVTVRDANNKASLATGDVTLNVYDVVQIVSTSPLPDAYRSSAYTQSLAYSGGKDPISWSVVAGALPSGFSLSTAGVLSVPTTVTAAAGTYSFTIRAKDANNRSSQKVFSVDVVQPLVVATSALADATQGSAYAATLGATGGRPPYQWTATGLPPGVSVDIDTGAVSGSPTVAGAYTPTATVTDANGVQVNRALSLQVYDPVSITSSATLTPGYAAVPYTNAIAATGGKGALTWAVTAGALPGGLTLSAGTGDLTGTPTAGGSSSFTVTVSDSATVARTATRTFSVAITPRPTVKDLVVADAYTGSAYSQLFEGQDGKPPYAWSLPSGGQPAGLVLDPSTGILSGTTSNAGSFTFTVRATDANGVQGDKSVTLVVYTPPDVAEPAQMSDAYASVSYSHAVAALNGKQPYSWSISAGSAPAGLSLTSAGTLQGTPSTAGTSSFTLRVTDANGRTATKGVSLTVLNLPSVLAGTMPEGYVNENYAGFTVTAQDGRTPYTFAVTSANLPAGMTFIGGVFGGRPTAAFSGQLTVQVTDANGKTASRPFDLIVYRQPQVTTVTASLPNAYAGSAYSTALAATDGKAPYTWSLNGGSALPAGLAVQSNGTLSGTTTAAAGAFTFAVTATDANGRTASSASLVLTLRDALAIATAALPDGYAGDPYAFTIAATGGTTTYTWSASGLPPGISIGLSTGALSGNPSADGPTTPTITVTDGNGVQVSRSLGLVVRTQPAITASTLADAYKGTPYSQSVSGTGGRTPYTFSVGAGLPPGLTLASGGSITGTATASGSSFTVTMTDANGKVAPTRSFSIPVLDALQITTTSVDDFYATENKSFPLAKTGGKPSFSWAITAGTLPSGVTLDSSTGVLSGTPTEARTDLITFQLTDGNGVSVSKVLRVTSLALPAIASSPLPDAYPSVAYAATVAVTGGRTPFLYEVTGGLPTGLSINASTGALSGSTAVVGPATVALKVTDANLKVATANVPLEVLATLQVTTTTLVDAYQTESYSQAVAATGGRAPLSYSVSSGALPGWAALNAGSGLLSSAAVTSAGTFTFTVTATDANGHTGSRSLTLAAYALPTVFTASLKNAYVNGTYDVQLLGQNGKLRNISPTPYAWSIVSGALPSSIAISASGRLTSASVPLADVGTYPVRVQLTDDNGRTATADLTLQVLNAFSITTASISDGYLTIPFSQTFQAAGGSGSYSWTISAGTLPPGMTLSTAGVLSGTPTATGAHAFTVQADDGSLQDTQSYTMTVYALPAISTASLPPAYTDQAYSPSLNASGGKSPLTWSLTSGTLPAGISLDASTGSFSGTPTTPSSRTFTVTVTDPNGQTDSRAFTVDVFAPPAIAAFTVPDGYGTVAYALALSASGGKGTLGSWSALGLPASLSINPGTGAITGTPTAAQAGTYPFTVSVSDQGTRTVSRGGTLVVYQLPSISTLSLPVGYHQVAYSTQVSATLGKAPYSFALTTGSLPAGVTLATDGTLSGTPTSSGAFALGITVSDANAQTFTRPLTLTISAPLSVTTVALADGYRGLSYQKPDASPMQLVGAGGRTPYTWSLEPGYSAPSGLSLSGTGLLSGTPDFTGGYFFVVRLTDANGTFVTQNYSLTVRDPVQITTSSTLPEAYVNRARSTVLSATGGTWSYSWALAAGSTLPAGLSLDSSTGTLGGTPTTSGFYSFGIVATDGNNVSATSTFFLTVNDDLVVSTPSLPDAYASLGYYQTLTATGGHGPLSWSFSAGELPPSLNVYSDGTVGYFVDGAQVVHGASKTFTVTVSDWNGETASSTFTIGTYFPPTFGALAQLPNGYEGVNYMASATAQVQVSATLGKGTLVYSGTGLPPGLSIDPVNGKLTGTPSRGSQGWWSPSLVATDSNGVQGNFWANLLVDYPKPVKGGGARATPPLSNPISDDLTVFVRDQNDLPHANAAVRVRKNGVEYVPAKEALTDSFGRVLFEGLGLTGSDTVDITAAAPEIATVSWLGVNAAVVTLQTKEYPLPGNRSDATWFYDPGLDSILVVGGSLSSNDPDKAVSGPSFLNQAASCLSNVAASIPLQPLADGGTSRVEFTELAALGATGAPVRRNMAGASVNGAMILAGGVDCASGQQTPEAFAFRPDAGWTALPPTPFNYVYDITAVGAGQRAYFYGGQDCSKSSCQKSPDLYAFDTVAATWSKLPPAPASDGGTGPAFAGRSGPAMGFDPIAGRVLICGGIDQAGLPLADCFSFHVPSQTWRPEAPLPTARSSSGIGFNPADGSLYLFGGYDQTTYSYRNDLLRYDFGSSSWTELVPHNPSGSPWGLARPSLFYSQPLGKLVIAGGYSGPQEFWSWDGAAGYLRLGPDYVYSNSYEVGFNAPITGGRPDGQWMADISAATSSGQTLHTTAYSNGGGTGSWYLYGIPQGDRVVVSATTFQLLPSGQLGPAIGHIDLPERQMDNWVYDASLDFPVDGTGNPLHSPTVTTSGAYSLPAGWTDWGLAATAAANFGGTYPTTAPVNLSAMSADAGLYSVDYYPAPVGATQTLLAQSAAASWDTCERVQLNRLAAPAGSNVNLILPTAPKSLSPGRSECSLPGTGFEVGGSGGPNSTWKPTYVVDVGPINSDGFPDLAVASEDHGSGAMPTVYTYLNDRGQRWSPPVAYPLPLGSNMRYFRAIKIADVLGDANRELLVLDSNNGELLILKGLPNGLFDASPGGMTVISGLASPMALAVGDIDRDGNPDLVVAEQGASRIAVIRRQPSGLFNPPSYLNLPNSPIGVALTDFNGDNRLDLVTGVYPNEVRVFIADFAGNYSGAPVVTPVPSVGTLQAIAVGDVFGDTVPEVVVLLDNGSTSSEFVVLSGVPPSSFSLSARTSVPGTGGSTYPQSLVLGKFETGPNKADVVLGDGLTGRVGLFANPGVPFSPFSFRGQTEISPNYDPQAYEVAAMAVADLNGDAQQDLVAVGGYYGAVKALLKRFGTLPTATDGPYAFTLPTNTRFIQLRRGVPRSATDWIVYAPASAGAMSVSLPAMPTLRTPRALPANQSVGWAVQSYQAPAPLDLNNTPLVALPLSGASGTGEYRYRRQ